MAKIIASKWLSVKEKIGTMMLDEDILCSVVSNGAVNFVKFNMLQSFF